MLNNSLFEIKNLTIDHEQKGGLSNFSLTMAPGEIHLIVGEQNSGKSLITRSIFQMLPMGMKTVQGGVFFREKRLQKDQYGIIGDRITPLFANPDGRFYPFYSLNTQLEDLLWHFRQRINRKTYLHILHEKMALLGMNPQILKQYPHEIERDQLFQIFLLAALMPSPDLIVIDRTFSAMDVSLRRRMLKVLFSIQRQNNIALLWVTHNLSLARRYADRITVIYRGHILEQGDAALIFKNPAHPYTRDMIRAEDSITGEKKSKPFFPGKHYRDLTPDAKGCKFYKRCNRHGYACLNQFSNDLIEIGSDHLVNCLNRE